MSSDPDTLSNRVVHMSVQLFSNESLALKMVEELSLLHVMIISLKLMMSKILIPNSLHGKQHYDLCFFHIIYADDGWLREFNLICDSVRLFCLLY